MTEKEPTFRIDIRPCSFKKLDQDDLIKKLKLMCDLGFVGFYTIVEDTDSVPELPKPETKEK